ncbi:unnamed protein product [Darwinula stevensoni]|uniref:Metalloendopeptidase n=1 Tax=Darwinula stevensoni TaxID=69355 RepID=A0A7R8XKJ2_9CRUS|nr:unnamed protein product [Darwinula stevensoni]CAG0895809.1 unnamed protein product [Darwinula stevensoni]
MLPFVSLSVLVLTVSCGALPRRPDPDQLMYNEGMLGGDIAGGYIRTIVNGKTALLPDSFYGLWTDAVVYYELHSSAQSIRDLLNAAIAEYHQHTCIRFVERNGNPSITSYVNIRGDEAGCWSYVGMYKFGPQDLSIQIPGCNYKGTILHELMHAVGFFHEHTRFDRDDYVIIHWENIVPGYEYAFDIVTLAESQEFGVPYDFGSIMHYELDGFTNNGENTIEPYGEWAGTDPGNVWEQNFFSQSDIDELNALYCSKK